ncbi:MAG TPA: hypothetical protein VHE59_17145 [Mucilaginibacter sp.]|nr:hypothetical protein [Mucilaginibacter sp.]
MSIFDIFRKDYLHYRGVDVFKKGVLLFEKAEYSPALERFQTALSLLKRAKIEQHKKNELIINTLSIISRTHKEMCQFDQAEQCLLTAISINPNDAGLYESMGFLKLDQKQFDLAIPWFEKIIMINPTEPDGYYWKGVVLLN